MVSKRNSIYNFKKSDFRNLLFWQSRSLVQRPVGLNRSSKIPNQGYQDRSIISGMLHLAQRPAQSKAQNITPNQTLLQMEFLHVLAEHLEDHLGWKNIKRINNAEKCKKQKFAQVQTAFFRILIR